PHPLPLIFTPPPTPATSPLSLHDALPISAEMAVRQRLGQGGLIDQRAAGRVDQHCAGLHAAQPLAGEQTPRLLRQRQVEADDVRDRKSTRLNSSHRTISYAVFCLKKKKNK